MCRLVSCFLLLVCLPYAFPFAAIPSIKVPETFGTLRKFLDLQKHDSSKLLAGLRQNVSRRRPTAHSLSRMSGGSSGEIIRREVLTESRWQRLAWGFLCSLRVFREPKRLSRKPPSTMPRTVCKKLALLASTAFRFGDARGSFLGGNTDSSPLTEHHRSYQVRARGGGSSLVLPSCIDGLLAIRCTRRERTGRQSIGKPHIT